MLLILAYLFLATIPVLLPLSALTQSAWEAFTQYAFRNDAFWILLSVYTIALPIVIAPAIWIASRTFLVLPAISVELPNASMATSAKLTYGNRGNMAGAIVLGALAPLTIIHLLEIIYFVFGLSPLADVNALAADLLGYAAGFITVTAEVAVAVMAVTLLTSCFRKFAGPLPHEVASTNMGSGQSRPLPPDNSPV